MLTLFALVATAGTHEKIKNYILPDSKANLFLEISRFLEEHPQYRVPDSLLWLTEEYGGSLSEQTADSVSFHFYIADSKIGNIYWCTFSGAGNDWEANRCEFGFIGVKTQDNELLYDSKLDNKRESYLIETLEKNIILPIMARIEKKKKLKQ